MIIVAARVWMPQGLHARLRRLAVSAFMLALAVLAPAAALACPTCYASASQRVISSYVLSAVILTLLPFAIIAIGAGIALYLRRQARALAGARAPTLDPSA